MLGHSHVVYYIVSHDVLPCSFVRPASSKATAIQPYSNTVIMFMDKASSYSATAPTRKPVLLQHSHPLRAASSLNLCKHRLSCTDCRQKRRSRVNLMLRQHRRLPRTAPSLNLCKHRLFIYKANFATYCIESWCLALFPRLFRAPTAATPANKARAAAAQLPEANSTYLELWWACP